MARTRSTAASAAVLLVVGGPWLAACGSGGGGTPTGGAGHEAPAAAAPPAPSRSDRTPDGPSPAAGSPDRLLGGAAVPIVRATPPPRQRPVAAPMALRIADVTIDAAVRAVGVDADGAMELPEDPDRAGWYRWSARPGTTSGTTVLAAHVDSIRYGVGQFARLRDTEEGARIDVRRRDDRTVAYRVTSVQRIERRTVPLDEIFAREGPHRLVVVTCGGPFDPDAGGYQDNLVVTAEPVDAAG